MKNLINYLISTCFAMLVCLATASAQTYPLKPIRLIVPQAPGGGLDIATRVFATYLGESIGQQIVIDNKVGGGGSIGISAAAAAAADGYTIVIGSTTTMAANNFLYKGITVNPLKDFIPLAMLGTIDFALVVPGASSINSVSDLIAAAKAKPGSLSYGFGSSAALICGEMLKSVANVNIVKIAYKGTPQSLTDLVAGRIDLVCEPLGTSLQFSKVGKLKNLAVTSVVRNNLAPEVPTMAEAGLPFQHATWAAFFAPAGTPSAIASKLSAEILKVMSRPDVQEKIRVSGFVPKIIGAEELGQIHKNDWTRMEKVVREAGITAE